jgi:2-(1,2-epoxy-1,2-dihydrophenyl)acetyl-CoA isomerase
VSRPAATWHRGVTGQPLEAICVSDTVLLDLTPVGEGVVATVTLNRAEAMNSLTVEAKEALLETVTGLAADPRVRALVLTGTGRAFCVGQDLNEHAALLESGDPSPLSTVSKHYNPVVTALSELPYPTIAAINGTAAGAGLGLACALDLRIGATGARYTTAFAGVGLSTDSGLSWTLPRIVGAGQAMELLLLAQPFTSEQALELGLLNQLVAPEEVLPTAQALAARLAAGPTAAYGYIKQAVSFAASKSLAEALREEDRLQTMAGGTADHATAVRSFLAKEKPVFTGR